MERGPMFLIVQHTVRDYDAWRPAFDAHGSVRAEYGCRSHTIYRDPDNPNDVTILLDYASRERAEEFMKDPSLAEAMQRGGVVSEPSFRWLEEADRATYGQRQAA